MRFISLAGLVAALAAGALAAGAPAAAARPLRQATATPIKHFIFLMQANRTFDNYFGTYPGADGMPASVCQPLSLHEPRHNCVKPFVLSSKPQMSLATNTAILAKQYDNGKMDGFVAAYQARNIGGRLAMGYYNQKALPFYWSIAHDYVLFDHFFSASLAGAGANLSYWVTAAPPTARSRRTPLSAHSRQLTIFDRLQAAGVSWKFYVQGYESSGSHQRAAAVRAADLAARIPLLNNRRFTGNGPLSRHIVGLDQYYKDVVAGTLPAVSFIAGSAADNERSARTILAGQELVRSLVTQLMLSRDWNDSALLWSYDGSGGHYDHVKPPRAGSGSLGFRVPALLVSAYARRGLVDHEVLSYGSALRFIEQNWHLAPLTRWDASAQSLVSAFNFAARPRPADILPPLTSSPATASLPQRPVPVTLVYLLYGSAAAAAVALVFRASRAARAGRGPDLPGKSTQQTGAPGR